MACHLVGQLVPWPGHLVICLFSSFVYLFFLNLFLFSRKAVSFTEIPVCGKCQHIFVFVLIQKENRCWCSEILHEKRHPFFSQLKKKQKKSRKKEKNHGRQCIPPVPVIQGKDKVKVAYRSHYELLWDGISFPYTLCQEAAAVPSSLLPPLPTR